VKFFAIEQAIHLWLQSMMFENLVVRFPNLRFASVENGAEFLPDLFRKLRSIHKKVPGWFPEDPVELFRRHVWINPFWEDDIVEIVGLMGADRVLFGSDWPHIEGMPAPLDYLVEVKDLDPADRRRVLLDNALELQTPRPR
jgi:predicted TIM-barrel fold metal-dependent hydrolase